MKNITMIAAVGKNLELGKDNDLIWHFKEDMKFFKENTINKPIVMGMGVKQNKGIVGDLGIKASIDKEFCNEKYVLDISKIIVEGIGWCF